MHSCIFIDVFKYLSYLIDKVVLNSFDLHLTFIFLRILILKKIEILHSCHYTNILNFFFLLFPLFFLPALGGGYRDKVSFCNLVWS